MFRFLAACILFMSFISCGKGGSGDAEEESSVGSAMLTGKTGVKKSSNFHAQGVFVGRPIKTSERGIIFNTYEARVSAGSFQNTFFLGNSINVSFEDKKIFDQFQSLDTNQTYIFQYEQPYFLNPEIEETHMLIRSIEPLKNMSFPAGGIKNASIEKTGNYSSGTRPGRIILVRRWGFFDIDCSVELNMGALGTTIPESALVGSQLPASQGNIENAGMSSMLGLKNSIVMNVYSEEGCAFAEKALMSGRDVIIDYTEDHVELWDKYSRIIDKIQLDTAPKSPSTAPGK